MLAAYRALLLVRTESRFCNCSMLYWLPASFMNKLVLSNRSKKSHFKMLASFFFGIKVVPCMKIVCCVNQIAALVGNLAMIPQDF